MRIVIAFIFSLPITFIFSQNPNQELIDAIQATPNWDQKTILYDSLANKAGPAEIQYFISTLNWIATEAITQGQYDFAADYLIEATNMYFNNSLPTDSANQRLNEILRTPQLSQGKRGDVLASKALTYFSKNQLDSTLYYYLASSRVFEELRDSSQVSFGRAYLHAAGVAMDLGKFTQASDLLDRSRLIFEHQKDNDYLLYVLNDAANLYSMNGFLEKASKQREEIIKIADLKKNLDLVLVTCLNWSNEARKLKNDSLELVLLTKSIELIDSASNSNMQYHYIALSKLINAFSRRDIPKQAIYYFNLMQLLEPRFRNTAWLKQYFQRAKVDALYSQNEYSSAIKLAGKIQNNALSNKEIETVMDMDRMLHRIYYASGAYKKAYDYFNSYMTIKDSLATIEKTNALLYLETQNEDERKKRVIADQENEITLLATTNLFQTKLLWTIFIGLIPLFGAIYLYRSRKYAVKSQQMQEDFSQKLLTSHEDERKRISMDLHDSVGQSLMLIKNKIVLEQDEETVTMVSQALEEVRTISKALHPVLLEKIGLTSSIEKLIADFDENTEILFTQEIEKIDDVFSKEHELHFFRILQEAISNMVKHANTPSALIKITNEDKKVVAMIKDFGVGFDITDQNRSTGSLGMKTLKERTQIMGGKLLIDSTKNVGTSVLLEIPKANT